MDPAGKPRRQRAGELSPLRLEPLGPARVVGDDRDAHGSHPVTMTAGRALDVGCGAGLSTAALAPLARQVIGLEPISAMLAHRQTVAPRAAFVIGQAERLPFPAGSFDLVAARAR